MGTCGFRGNAPAEVITWDMKGPVEQTAGTSELHRLVLEAQIKLISPQKCLRMKDAARSSSSPSSRRRRTFS